MVPLGHVVPLDEAPAWAAAKLLVPVQCALEPVISRLQYHDLRIAQIIEETADARSLVFDVPEALRESFRYRPGQFLTLKVPLGEQALPRCYSASSSPLLDEPLRVTVKRVVDGRASNWLCDTLRTGDRLAVAPPAGVFVPKSLDGDFLLLAGGSGITPVLSILRSLLHAGQGRARLVYANRDERSVIFAEELARLSREFPRRLQLIHWLDSVQGLPSQAQLAELARGWEQAQAFICGPAVFMDGAAAALQDAGFGHGQVHIERFVSLPEDAEELPAAPLADAAEVNITVHLDGQQHRVSGQRGQILLDALDAAGLDAPYSCRSGACAACMCRLDAGEVALVHNHVLDRNDLDQGWILACQAQMQSDTLTVSYPE